MTPGPEPRRVGYRFGPLERRGLLGALAAGQAGTLALGAVIAVVLLDRVPSAAGVATALVVGLLAAVVAFAPIGGRTLDEWAPVAAGFGARRTRGRHRVRSRAPQRGRRVGYRTRPASSPPPDAPPRADDPDRSMPHALGGVRIVTASHRGRDVGALSERGGRRLTVVLACRSAAFALLDREAQERRLARFGLVLAGASGGAIRRLQWIERTAPAQGDELARWLHDERDASLAPRGSAMLESYLELISTSTRVAQEHELLLAVQIDARRVRARGGAAALAALIEAGEQVAQGLEAAEVTVLGALGPDPLARTLRTAFDPYARAELAALGAAGPSGPGHERHGADPADAWPIGAREGWDHYVCDGARHATFWISGWPKTEVSPMFMDALLGHSSAVRTVAVSFEPCAPERATREVEAAVTRDRADRELRQRFGQSETARQRQAADATMRREAELAAGHGEVRLSGFVTVSGRDAEELRRGCGEVLDHAARARLTLRRMYGQQAEAFTFTLPLCRGLR